ncbi:MAG TPA: hypothetical protein PKI19_07360 [Elusimicrobiales bacterium]|nr:hypothetical protein [Elusimicrobiales bacterium]
MTKPFTLCLLAGLLLLPAAARAQYYLDAEAGAAWADHNTVKIPLKGGNRFSLTDELKADAAPFVRVRAGRRSGKSDWSFLAAPLTLRSEGTFARAVNFNGQVFAAATPTKAVYRFNSYRVKYLYEFSRSKSLVLRWGGALKMRHAGIKLSNGVKSTESRNTGFVPLAAFSGAYKFSPGYELNLDAEALGAPQGRAEDIMLAVSKELAPGRKLRLGYRFLEGGSGAGEVYTFAWIHYLLAGFTWEF